MSVELHLLGFSSEGRRCHVTYVFVFGPCSSREFQNTSNRSRIAETGLDIRRTAWEVSRHLDVISMAIAMKNAMVVYLLIVTGLAAFQTCNALGQFSDDFYHTSPLPGPNEKPRVPDAFGVNIHIHTEPRAGEMEMIAASGVKWIRMDFSWGATELQKGVYNFTDYDLLTASLRRNELGAIYILDYTNSLYDGGLSPHTDAGRSAFAVWAAAAAAHFKSDKILWEMYNEPNIKFWTPKPNVQDYVALALAVGKIVRLFSVNSLSR